MRRASNLRELKMTWRLKLEKFHGAAYFSRWSALVYNGFKEEGHIEPFLFEAYRLDELPESVDVFAQRDGIVRPDGWVVHKDNDQALLSLLDTLLPQAEDLFHQVAHLVAPSQVMRKITSLYGPDHPDFDKAGPLPLPDIHPDLFIHPEFREASSANALGYQPLASMEAQVASWDTVPKAYVSRTHFTRASSRKDNFQDDFQNRVPGEYQEPNNNFAEMDGTVVWY
ncbi:hypothetical protein BDY21DRAFT_359892 [Lineolata rhizophorae]|uniref:Uncharacterized protein n=1 Tax=Lineolata rhizophorae TaxID=578093 RepID=A0A6A6PD01_9PEZI|nr:hypothetical protein BDY21DRAFT_359892 [Lineolata rhizophorae]